MTASVFSSGSAPISLILPRAASRLLSPARPKVFFAGKFCSFKNSSYISPLEKIGCTLEKSKKIWFFVRFALSLQREMKSVRIMTALELNAELYRAMGEIADNETLLAKVLAYVKGLVTTQQKRANASARNGWAAAAKQAHADGEDKLMAADVFEDETMEDWKW